MAPAGRGCSLGFEWPRESCLEDSKGGRKSYLFWKLRGSKLHPHLMLKDFLVQTEPRASRVSLGWRCQPESHSSRPPAGNGVSAAAQGDPNVTAANRLIPKFYSMLVAGLEGCFASSCLLKQRSYPGGAQTRVGIQLRAPSLGTSQGVPQTRYPVPTTIPPSSTLQQSTTLGTTTSTSPVLPHHLRDPSPSVGHRGHRPPWPKRGHRHEAFPVAGCR